MRAAIKSKNETCPSCSEGKRSPFIQRQFKASGSRPKVQTKLKIGHPNDKYEREADAMAERVMRMPMETPGAVMEKQEQPGVQLKCAACEEQVQTKTNRTVASDHISNSLSTQLNASKGRGSPMSNLLNRKMSEVFGHDFSRVRIHTGNKANEMNNQLSARAFTCGSDIYFNQGEYAPHSPSGNKLLAHELTHVAQQQRRSTFVQAKFKLNELKKRNKSDLKTSPQAYFYRGSPANVANKKAVIIAGLHAREKSPCELAKIIRDKLEKKSLVPDLHTIIIPCVVPFKKGERGIGSDGERVEDANRAFGASDPSPNPKLNNIIQIFKEFDPDQTVSIHAINKPSLSGIFLDPKHSKGKFPATNTESQKRKAFTLDARNEEAMRLTEDMITEARRSEGRSGKHKTTTGNEPNKKKLSGKMINFPQNKYPKGGKSPFNLLYPQQGQVNTGTRPTSLGTWLSSLGKTVITMELPGYAKAKHTWKDFIPALERFLKVPGTRVYGPEIYTEEEKLKYLIGIMDRKKAGLDFGKVGQEVSLGKGKKPLKLTKNLNLRESSFSCLAAMMKAAKKDGHDIVPFSGTRLFKDQKRIWEEKYSFTRAGKWGRLSPRTWKTKYPRKCFGLKDTEDEWNSDRGRNGDHKKCWQALTGEEKAREILKTSSGPGFSRHHWGTDIDLNSDDPSMWNKNKILIALYKWLQKTCS